MKHVKSTTPFFQITFTIAFASGMLFSASCKTYHIPIDSFKEQFTITDSSQLKPVVLGGGILIYANEKYLTKNLDYIDCIDNKGRRHKLKMSPKLEIRLSYLAKNKERKVSFFLDRTYVTKDSITGFRSRLIGLPKTISIQSIRKIEIQNDHKNYYYLNP